MKIIFLAPFGLRPKGTVIARMVPLAAELQTLGHQVVIIAPPYTNPDDSGKMEVVRGVPVKNITLGPRNKVIGAPVLAWRLFRAALAEKPDLVHLFKPKGYGGLAVMFQLQLERMGIRMPPLFLDTDDWEGGEGMNALHDYSRLERRVYDFQEAWLPPRATGVTVASRTLEEQVRSMGVERVLYIPNCAEAIPQGSGAVAREKMGILPDAPVALLYTRFFEFDQQKLYSLFDEIFRRVAGVRFLVVGKGRNNEEALLAQAGERMGFAPALAMAGWVEPAELPDYLAAGDVAIYPFADTLVNSAKCPAKLTEILRAGVPVVADRVGQLTEYVKPGVSGVLCDPDNWKEMADHAVHLLLDREAGRELGAAGCRYLLETFNWNIYAVRLNDFYRESVSQKSFSGRRHTLRGY